MFGIYGVIPSDAPRRVSTAQYERRKFQLMWSHGGPNHEKMVPKTSPRPVLRGGHLQRLALGCPRTGHRGPKASPHPSHHPALPSGWEGQVAPSRVIFEGGPSAYLALYCLPLCTLLCSARTPKPKPHPTSYLSFNTISFGISKLSSLRTWLP